MSGIGQYQDHCGQFEFSILLSFSLSNGLDNLKKQANFAVVSYILTAKTCLSAKPVHSSLPQAFCGIHSVLLEPFG